jgi:hypothetical protein
MDNDIVIVRKRTRSQNVNGKEERERLYYVVKVGVYLFGINES